MADQVRSGTVQGVMSESSGEKSQSSEVEPLEGLLSPGKHVPFHGRPASWVSVCTIILGFIIGGAGLVVGPTWWLFWTGGAVAVVGGILALATGVVNDWY